MPKKKKRTKDLNLKFFQDLGRKGGKLRAKKLSKKRRIASARKAAKARWVA